MNALGYVLGLYALYMFRKMGLEVKYQKEIMAWLLAMKQEKFSKKLGKQIIDEVERYMRGETSIKELLEKKFPRPEFTIEDNR